MIPAILLPLIAKLVPDVVGHFYGNRAAEASTLAMGAVQKITGSSDPAEQVRALESNTEAANALALGLRRLHLEEMKLANEDRANARQREVATGDHWTPRVLALLFTIALCAVMWVVLSWVDVTPGQKELANLIVGFLFAKIGTILDYYFGASVKSGR